MEIPGALIGANFSIFGEITASRGGICSVTVS